MSAVRLTDQQSLVLDYLNNHPYITGQLSIVCLGVLDLRKRVSELRRLGYPIADRMVSRKNRYGKTVSFKEYFFEEVENVGFPAAES